MPPTGWLSRSRAQPATNRQYPITCRTGVGVWRGVARHSRAAAARRRRRAVAGQRERRCRPAAVSRSVRGAVCGTGGAGGAGWTATVAWACSDWTLTVAPVPVATAVLSTVPATASAAVMVWFGAVQLIDCPAARHRPGAGHRPGRRVGHHDVADRRRPDVADQQGPGDLVTGVGPAVGVAVTAAAVLTSPSLLTATVTVDRGALTVPPPGGCRSRWPSSSVSRRPRRPAWWCSRRCR